MNMQTTSVRTRSRRIPAFEAVQPVSNIEVPVTGVAANASALDAKLAEYFRANTRSNAFKREADKAKRELHKMMINDGVVDFTASVELDDGVRTVQAAISAPEGEAISVERLRALVDDETFMRIVKATKTAVTEHAGTNVAIKATVPVVEKEDLRIKELKA
jgi:uncharacterized protein with GYD domain